MTKLSLDYLHRLPKTNKNTKPPLLLLLHGYGSNEADLFSFAEHLPDEFLIVSARAPLSLGFQSYAWFTINFDTNNGNYSDIPEALDVKEKIVAFIDELKSVFSFDADNVSLLGFSQGCILSFAIALSYPNKIKNVVGLSGYIKEDLITVAQDTNAYKKLDIFASHGSQDQVIPFALSQKTPDYLNKLDLSNCFKTYPAGHTVTQQNFNDFNQWLLKKL